MSGENKICVTSTHSYTAEFKPICRVDIISSLTGLFTMQSHKGHVIRAYCTDEDICNKFKQAVSLAKITIVSNLNTIPTPEVAAAEEVRLAEEARVAEEVTTAEVISSTGESLDYGCADLPLDGVCSEGFDLNLAGDCCVAVAVVD